MELNFRYHLSSYSVLLELQKKTGAVSFLIFHLEKILLGI